MKKINYTTAYDTNNTIFGHVRAEEHDGYYTITSGQYKRALKNRTIGGVVGIVFDADKPVYVVDEYGACVMSSNESQLLEMIRDSVNPDAALLRAISIITKFINDEKGAAEND